MIICFLGRVIQYHHCSWISAVGSQLVFLLLLLPVTLMIKSKVKYNVLTVVYENLYLLPYSWLPPFSPTLLWPHRLPCPLQTLSTNPLWDCGLAVSSAWNFSPSRCLHCIQFSSQFHLLIASFPKLDTKKVLLIIPNPLTLLYFSSQVLSMSEAILVYIVTSLPH